jgi:hypothetical protein
VGVVLALPDPIPVKHVWLLETSSGMSVVRFEDVGLVARLRVGFRCWRRVAEE